MLWMAALITIVAACVDLHRRQIPDVFPAALLLCAGAGALTGVAGWGGMAGGATVGFAVGAVLFGLGAFGGGDAKLLVGVGACLGPVALVSALVPMALAGGLLSLIALWRGAREVVYGPAIAAGLVAVVLQGGA